MNEAKPFYLIPEKDELHTLIQSQLSGESFTFADPNACERLRILINAKMYSFTLLNGNIEKEWVFEPLFGMEKWNFSSELHRIEFGSQIEEFKRRYNLEKSIMFQGQRTQNYTFCVCNIL